MEHFYRVPIIMTSAQTPGMLHGPIGLCSLRIAVVADWPRYLVDGDNVFTKCTWPRVAKCTWPRVVIILPINSHRVSLQKADICSLVRDAINLFFQIVLRSKPVHDPRKSLNML
jgi:hypothetical protein